MVTAKILDKNNNILKEIYNVREIEPIVASPTTPNQMRIVGSETITTDCNVKIVYGDESGTNI